MYDKEKTKALLLFSGGLDSLLSALILKSQGIKVIPVFFKSYFFDEKQAKKGAKLIGLKLKVVNFGREHLKIVKNPQYGRGNAFNPCIDCHLLMLKKAKEIMMKEGYDFVATGEVLGERPFSQNKKALLEIEKEAGLKGLLLRPLSAKLLEPTEAEKGGLVDRKKLLDIDGRSRKRQLELASKFGLKEFPTPAGGCLLTDKIFGQRISKLFRVYPPFGKNEIDLLKIGRHFWIGKNQIIVGRNEKENKKIKKLIKKGDVLIEMENYPGPTTLVRNYGGNKTTNEVLKRAKQLTCFYSTKARRKKDVNYNIYLL